VREVDSSPYSNTGDGPVITFIDDDGNPLWFDIWGPICAAQGITMSLGLITGRVTGAIVDPTYASVTLAQAQSIEALGHDILCHSYSHLSTDSTSVADLDADWLAGQEWMQANFPACADVLVYPGGLTTADVAKKNVARKYFRYGIATNNVNSYNTQPLDSWLVQRVDGVALTEAQLKTQIDTAITNNGWLIVLTHSYNLDANGRAASITKLNNVIDYAQGLSVPILPWSAAEKLKGNAVAIGEFTDPAHRSFTSHMGKRVSVDTRGKFTPTLYGATTAGTHTYTTQTGFYDVVDGMVFVRVSLKILTAGWDATCSGALKIGGLPSPVLVSTRDISPPVAVNFNYFNLGAGYYSVWAKFAAANFINLMKNGTGVSEDYLTTTDVDATKTLMIDFWAVWMAADNRWTVL